MNLFDNFLKLFPFFASLLLFLGFANLFYTYSPYGLNIYPYLNSSEILLSFLPILLISVLWGAITIISILVIFSLRRLLGKEVISDREEETQKGLTWYTSFLQKEKFKRLNWKKRLFLFKKILIHFYTIYFFVLLLFSILYSIGYANTCEEPDGFYALLIGWGNLFLILILKLFRGNGLYKIVASALIIFGCVLIVFATRNFCEFERVTGNETNVKISFDYNGTRVECDSTLVYINATQNYLFLYDRSGEKVEIFNKSKISHLSFKVLNIE